MGKGDKKTKKGKISMGSYGNSRPQKDRNKQNALTIKSKSKISK
ncbi:MAG: 30S ribosomal protein THX [Chitinophagaceae bacterium]|nr:30S ribosomal protein THX [Chitinophagaceae bacterium]